LAESVREPLSILDDDGPALRVVAEKNLVPEGQNPGTTITVMRNTVATEALVVTLNSSRTNEAIFGAPAIPVPNGGGAQWTITPPGGRRFDRGHAHHAG
jgi:hypothetical protein